MANSPNDKSIKALRQRLVLADDALAVLYALPTAACEQLCANVLAAEAAQDERVNQAIEGAVGFVPAPLRRRVRKLLFD